MQLLRAANQECWRLIFGAVSPWRKALARAATRLAVSRTQRLVLMPCSHVPAFAYVRASGPEHRTDEITPWAHPHDRTTGSAVWQGVGATLPEAN